MATEVMLQMVEEGSANTGPRSRCRAVRNQGQIGPKVIRTTDIRNALRVPLYGAPFVKILYLIDLAQKLLSLHIFS